MEMFAVDKNHTATSVFQQNTHITVQMIKQYLFTDATTLASGNVLRCTL